MEAVRCVASISVLHGVAGTMMFVSGPEVHLGEMVMAQLCIGFAVKYFIAGFAMVVSDDGSTYRRGCERMVPKL